MQLFYILKDNKVEGDIVPAEEAEIYQTPGITLNISKTKKFISCFASGRSNSCYMSLQDIPVIDVVKLQE